MLYDTILAALGLLVAILILAGIATRIRVPYPVLLVIGGGLLSFIPGLPVFKLNPDLVLLLFLPPLIYSAAWFTSWRDFRANLRSILLQAVGLVLVTMLLVAVTAHALIPGLSWPVAFVLGALLSPTDTVAAKAITQDMGISHNVTAIIEGESLVNDATALVAYNFAVAAVASGTFSLWQAGSEFVVVSVGGLALGLILAWPISRLHRYLNDAPLEILLTLLTPFAAYLLAEAIGVSGVLAVMSAGLYLGRRSATFFSSTTRLQADSFWNMLVFLFNGLIFLLIGLQLHIVLDDLPARSLFSLVEYALVVSIVVILVRLAWVFTVISVLRLLARLSLIRYQYAGWRNALVVGWTGMRGGVSLAAALAVPAVLANGTAFPERNLIIFLAFCVILATLIVQGLSLSPLIRLLGLQGDSVIKQEAGKARLAITKAALTRLDELAQEDWVPEQHVARLRTYYQHKIRTLAAYAGKSEEEREGIKEHMTSYQRLRQEILQAERMTIIRLRNEDKINDEVLHQLEREIDLEEAQLRR